MRISIDELNDLRDDRRAEPGNLSRRLRAIGHPVGPEDESQAWADVHDCIREARRAYQRGGTIPNFDALAALPARRRPGV